MDLLYPRRTVWMFVIKDVVMTLSGKTPSLFRHDLVRINWKTLNNWLPLLSQVGLHANSKQNHRFTLSVNAITKIPEKFVPKKYSMTSKVAKKWGYFLFKLSCRYLTRRGVANVQWVEILITATSTFAVPFLAESSLCNGRLSST